MAWTIDDMDQQTGKTVVITGAHQGYGYYASLAFAEKGANVVLAVPDLSRGRSVQEKITTIIPDAKLELMYLDLQDLSSIKSFVKEYKDNYKTLSILILNETIQSPQFEKTKEGFESQFGVNYLGHFALTGLLLDLLKVTPNSRVISIGNDIPKKTKLAFGHFKGSNKYNRDKFYIQSKLANMLFAKHLDEKFKQYNIQSLSICCKPLMSSKTEDSKRSMSRLAKLKSKGKDLKIDKKKGVLPILYAASYRGFSGGEYISLSKKSKNKLETPAESSSFIYMYDENVAHNLWQLSEKLCGVTYKF
ncbi:SDR family NAD(P)-dependent oxidoreductase [Ureibacillus acetophenoni]|uniref:NAD(P)-dependent dehydrogenase (Short-subunit alcohol dehydrogenase family) n=1 Tax=Ureibacillus acetophenoni TaxID=614649 RepID=A0A285U7I1_9BACL|nr:SDR family NAD(P)-dependent oxidoreductase [Ureibacillus acetophenoni]SOC37358.1 NAD(P)-dependent dehydrogenase (short-subunit alcohol dehydrogenase family) [Ureibacillus acetophenoni]